MAVSQLDRKRIEVWCKSRSPDAFADELRVEARYRGNSVTIVERRPPWHPSMGQEWTETRIAVLTWTPDDNSWQLRATDRNDRLVNYSETFQLGARLVDVLAELERDPTAIFWG